MQDQIELNIGTLGKTWETQKIGILKFYEFFEFSNVQFSLRWKDNFS